MKKTILIPTDFSIESLNILKQALSDIHEGDTCDILLVYGAHLPSSISDLLFLRKEELIRKLSDKEYQNACMVIKNKYSSKINSMQNDLFTGFTQNAFDTFLDSHHVTEIYFSENYASKKIPYKKGFNLSPYLKRCKKELIYLDVRVESEIPEKGTLAEIFVHNA